MEKDYTPLCVLFYTAVRGCRAFCLGIGKEKPPPISEWRSSRGGDRLRRQEFEGVFFESRPCSKDGAFKALFAFDVSRRVSGV